MKFYIDTANVDEDSQGQRHGHYRRCHHQPEPDCQGGPRLRRDAEGDCHHRGLAPISGEVKATTTDAEGMIAEGRAIYALDPKQHGGKNPP